MSGQWEVVGAKKTKTSKLPVPKNKEKVENKQKNVLHVNINEILPKSQVQNLYSAKNGPKENGKPKDKVVKPQEAKKPQKKVEKPQEVAKPKPKSIESALNSIDVEDLKAIYTKTKTLYPEAPIVGLKEVVQFLNQKIPVELNDPVFTSKPLGYPFSTVPSGLKSIIELSIKEAGKSNAQLFYDIALTSMATDMGKGLPAIGWKFYLQYIAREDPQGIASNLQKHITLEKSYQNRPNIGLSILWAVGQLGFTDLNQGLKVFEDLMLPLLDMKNYSHFVIKYLLDLLQSHKDVNVSKDEYLLILETVYGQRKNFPNDLRDKLAGQLNKLKLALFSKTAKDKLPGFVEPVLKRLLNNFNKQYTNGLCEILIEVFSKDATLLSTWNKVYGKNLPASALLLKYIDDHYWNDNLRQKINKKQLNELLNQLSETNEALSLKKKSDEVLKDCTQLVKKIQQKQAAKEAKKSCGGSSCGFFKTCFILAVLGGLAAVAFDTRTKCIQGTASKQLEPLCNFGNKSYTKLVEGLLIVDEQIENQLPNYKQKVSDVSQPYVKLLKDLGLVGYNLGVNVKEYVVEKYPAVVQSIDSYAPGLIEQTQKVASDVWTTSSVYYTRGVDYLKKEVFVGQLSPENIQKAITDAFTVTQQKVTEYYFWLYEKVQTSIK